MTEPTSDKLRGYGRGLPGVILTMATFLYRCPSTGLRVQGWLADDPAEHSDESYEAVTCLACSRVHLVNPKSGKVIGEDEE